MSLASCHCSTPRPRKAAPHDVATTVEGAAPHYYSTLQVKVSQKREPQAGINNANSSAFMSDPTKAPRPEWTPRIWEGMDFFAWMRLLLRNRFAVDRGCLYIAVIVTFVSIIHSAVRLLQEA